MTEERVIQLIALVVAELTVLFGWLAILAAVLYFVNRRVNRIAPPGSKMEPWGWLIGMACFCFWPAAVVLSVVFLREPKWARVGRACAIGGLLNVSAAVLAAELITVVLYVQFPEYIPR